MKTILLILLATNINAQSLISNGSFEVYSTIPYAEGQINFATGWKDFGSADYFTTLSAPISGVNLPNTFVGTVQPYEGIACAGIATYVSGFPDYREFLTIKLDTVMKVGYNYDVSLWVMNNPNPMIYGGIAASDFGIMFSTKKLQQPLFQYMPQNVVSGLLYAYGWKKVAFNFYADSAYKWITIGCFQPDSVQQRQVIVNSLFPMCYYFLDNIVVKKSFATGIEEYSQMAVKRKLNYNLLGQRIK